MSQTVREAAERLREFIHPVKFAADIEAVCAHVLASAESLGEITTAEAKRLVKLNDKEYSVFELSHRIGELARDNADLRAQLQAAQQERDDLAATNQSLINSFENFERLPKKADGEGAALQQLADERVAALEYWQNRAKYWKDRGAQFIEYATDDEIGEIPRPNITPAQENPDTAIERIINYFAELQNDGYDFDGNGWDKEPLRERILEIIADRTVFFEAILNPPAPNGHLKEATARYWARRKEREKA